MELNELRNVADIRSDLVQDGVLMYDEASEVLTRLEQAERVCDKLRNRLDAMRRQRDGYRNQLRKTEQQVARVRELAEEFDKHDYPRGIHRFSVAKRIRRALDGDGRG